MRTLFNSFIILNEKMIQKNLSDLSFIIPNHVIIKIIGMKISTRQAWIKLPTIKTCKIKK